MLTVADTAYAVAFIRAAESSFPVAERLFEDPYAAIFAAAGEHARSGTERFLSLPFLVDGCRLRTRFIDDAVGDAFAAGIDQLVLLGAGFDARGLRLPEVAARGVRVFEVDFEHQLATKRAILEKAGVAIPPSIAYVGCDFTVPDFGERLAADLVARGLRRDATAVYVWEGVIGYIDDATIDRTLRFVAGLTAAGSRLVFTFFDAAAVGGEAMTDRTRGCGFSACDDLSAADVWRRYWTTEPHEASWVMRLGIAYVG
jgi:methyltransferase (TIGR00027 family)